jgi:hypothetical protein
VISLEYLFVGGIWIKTPFKIGKKNDCDVKTTNSNSILVFFFKSSEEVYMVMPSYKQWDYPDEDLFFIYGSQLNSPLKYVADLLCVKVKIFPNSFGKKKVAVSRFFG